MPSTYRDFSLGRWGCFTLFIIIIAQESLQPSWAAIKSPCTRHSAPHGLFQLNFIASFVQMRTLRLEDGKGFAKVPQAVGGTGS